ncbi:hypothetical protein LTR70_002602 [Exophiala xenobiotica]|uniref:Cleft lip and palate associated transmembrane protein n=1 Tax=Lithohypha guttulata TaxID=1690604 RepID=A0ABR0KIA2_9EURO|nr:hypothetical protein LTR24_002221 [Lithohypha guttulata]KAK5325222.1 hypothetical protein LTR70_002602 [Exophiala xenobiotica]
MSTNNAAAAAPNAEDRGGTSLVTSITRSIALFLAVQVGLKYFTGGQQTASNDAGGTGGVSGVDSFADRPEISTIANYSQIPYNLAPMWAADSALDVRVHVSPKLQLPPLASLPPDSLIVSEDNFKMGDYKYNREYHTFINLPTEVQNNGSLYAHIFAALHGHELDPTSPSYDTASAAHYVKQLNRYLPKKRVRKERNLLDKSEAAEVEPEDKTPDVSSYWHSNFTLAVVPGTGTVNWRSMHPGMRKDIVMEPTGARDASGQNGWYYPVFFLNTFWQLRSHMTELNDTVESVPLNINLYNLANWKYSILASMDEGIKQQQNAAAFGTSNPNPAGGDGSEMEKFKEILLDSNPWLLGTTFIVSILHMVFEALAFKNDISHWKNKKDNIGTSVRTIMSNVFMQAIIFLYLVDNSDGTSWMILASQGFGIFVEAWKITKTANVVVKPPAPGSTFSFLPYVIILEDKHKLSDIEEKTEQYDAEAFRYMAFAAVPLLLAYAIYSLVYEKHKSVYSYVIETLVGSVYAYGFLMMVPQLYINYKLKSVSHMPGRALVYKTLGTFIDDLFAFTIRMPILHRLATFRDDIIFFIWLYQKWAYKVDYSRVNEFGQGGEEEDATKEKENEKAVQGQNTASMKPTAAVATSSGAEKKGGAGSGSGSGKKRR